MRSHHNQINLIFLRFGANTAGGSLSNDLDLDGQPGIAQPPGNGREIVPRLEGSQEAISRAGASFC
jgi:hypothetical protein